MTNYYRKIKRASEGIVERDGASNVDKKADSVCHQEPDYLITSVTKSPTLSQGAPLSDSLYNQEPDSVKMSPVV